MSGVVAQETPHVLEVLRDSGLTPFLAAPANGRLSHRAFNKNMGGFIGGDLFNVVTGAFHHIQNTPTKPMTERPLPETFKPESYIATVLTDLINQSHAVAAMDSKPNVSSFNLVNMHFCFSSEQGFHDEAEGRIPESRRQPEASISPDGGIVDYRKVTNGRRSSILLNGPALPVEHYILPEGTLGYRTVKNFSTWMKADDYSLTSADRVNRFAPCRISASAVPVEQRAETFKTPIGDELNGHLERHVEFYMPLDELRTKIAALILRPDVTKELLEKGMVNQETVAA